MDSTLFLLFWSEGRSFAPHTNPFPVLQQAVHSVSQTGNLSTLVLQMCMCIASFSVVSQEHNKDNALRGQTASKSTSSNIKDLDSKVLSKKIRDAAVLELLYISVTVGLYVSCDP